MLLTPETEPEKVIKAFIFIIKIERLLFEEYAPELWDLTNNLSDDPTTIVTQIATWCRQHSEIYEVLEDQIDHRGPAETIPAPEPEDYNTLLKNQVRESFPLQKSQKSSND